MISTILSDPVICIMQSSDYGFVLPKLVINYVQIYLSIKRLLLVREEFIG